EKNPPSLLLCAVVPLQQCDIVCDLCLLLYPFIHFPTLCERLDVQCFSRKDGLLNSCIMLSEAQPLPGSLLSAQKRPVVWRYRPVMLIGCNVYLLHCSQDVLFLRHVFERDQDKGDTGDVTPLFAGLLEGMFPASNMDLGVCTKNGKSDFYTTLRCQGILTISINDKACHLPQQQSQQEAQVQQTETIPSHSDGNGPVSPVNP
ncbi:hypothetical protein FQN60_008395, partial [Etheostoma spectabile]